MSLEEFLDVCEQESVMVIVLSRNPLNIYFVDDNDNRVSRHQNQAVKHQAFNAVENIFGISTQ